MKRVKYVGEVALAIPTLNLLVKPGDVIKVPDSFQHPDFAEAGTKRAGTKNKEEGLNV